MQIRVDFRGNCGILFSVMRNNDITEFKVAVSDAASVLEYVATSGDYSLEQLRACMANMAKQLQKARLNVDKERFWTEEEPSANQAAWPAVYDWCVYGFDYEIV